MNKTAKEMIPQDKIKIEQLVSSEQFLFGSGNLRAELIESLIESQFVSPKLAEMPTEVSDEQIKKACMDFFNGNTDNKVNHIRSLFPNKESVENEFIDSLFSEFKRQGIDTSNWDGEEGAEKAIVDGVRSLLSRPAESEDREKVTYGDYVQMDDRFESVHVWSEEKEIVNAGRWTPKKITKAKYDEEMKHSWNS